MQLTHILDYLAILLVHRRLRFYTNGEDDRDLFSLSINYCAMGRIWRKTIMGMIDGVQGSHECCA